MEVEFPLHQRISDSEKHSKGFPVFLHHTGKEIKVNNVMYIHQSAKCTGSQTHPGISYMHMFVPGYKSLSYMYLTSFGIDKICLVQFHF